MRYSNCASQILVGKKCLSKHKKLMCTQCILKNVPIFGSSANRFDLPSSRFSTFEFNSTYIVVSTNNRSQAKVFTVYFSLKYLECNNYNVHFTLTSLCPTNVCWCISPLHYTGQPELSSPY